MVKLKLIKTDTYEGYESENLMEFLEEKGLKDSFIKWSNSGITMAVHKEKTIIYKWDVERFLEGLPVLD